MTDPTKITDPNSARINELAEALGTNYADFGRIALTHILQRVHKPEQLESDLVLRAHGARVDVPLASVEAQGEIVDRTLRIGNINSTAFWAGGRSYDLARQGDTPRIYFPVEAQISLLTEPQGQPLASQFVAQFSRSYAGPGGSGFMGGDGSVRERNSLTEGDPRYDYLAGLLLQAYDVVLADPSQATIIEGTVDTFRKQSAEIHSRAHQEAQQ